MAIDMNDRSSAPAVVYHLAGDAELRPAVTPDPDLPAEVNGLPAFYYWKDAIFVGSYVHPTGGYRLDVTPQKLDAYVDTFSKMKTNGVGVPILADHTATAAATLGWIVDVKRDGDTLLELHQFLGESARETGLRNQVSLGIDPDFVDGRGRKYGEAIVHSAVTPVPVVPGQGGFEAVELSGDRVNVVTLSLAVKGPETAGMDRQSTAVPAAAVPAAAVGAAVGAAAGAGAVSATLAPEAAPPAVPEVIPDADLAAAAVRQVVAMKRDLAVARGGIDPASAGRVFDLLMAKPATMTMSLSRGEPAVSIAAAIFDALAANKPVPPGEVTGIQVLSRLVPGDDRSELQKAMIALASAVR